MTLSQITFLGHATMLVEVKLGSDTKKLLIDPFLVGNPLCPADFQSFSRLDGIVLTHGHADHASSAADVAIATGCPVYATWELCNLLSRDGVPEGQLQFMNKGGTRTLLGQDGITVTLTHAFHSSSYTLKNGETHYAGEAVGVVLRDTSGNSIYHAGDTALFGDLSLIGERYAPTVALLPIGDVFTMGPWDAALATELLGPKTVIPIHHSTFPMLTGTPEQFSHALKKRGVETDFRELKPGSSYRL